MQFERLSAIQCLRQLKGHIQAILHRLINHVETCIRTHQSRVHQMFDVRMNCISPDMNSDDIVHNSD